MTDSKQRISFKPLKWYKELSSSKGRLNSNAFIVEGEHAIRQIISNFPDQILELVSTTPLSSPYRSIPVRQVKEGQFHAISTAKTPRGIIAVVRLPVETYQDTLPDKIGDKIVLLEDIQDPGNVGTLIRSAAAFNFAGILLTDKSADPFSPKCIQSTAGSILSVWIRRTKNYLNLVNTLKQKDYTVFTTEVNGDQPPSALRQATKIILALGNESQGISDQLLKIADHRLGIPINRNKAQSLNVAASGAIFMFESC